MLGQHVAEFVVVGLFVLSLVLVVAEILVKDPGALLELLTGSTEMARPNLRGPSKSAQIHQFPGKPAEAAAAFRKAA